MNGMELSDRDLRRLLGQAPPLAGPGPGLAQRIALQAEATPQRRAPAPLAWMRRQWRRHSILWSTFFSVNLVAAAAAAATWDGSRFDIHRLTELPHRVWSAVHLRHRHSAAHGAPVVRRSPVVHAPVAIPAAPLAHPAPATLPMPGAAPPAPSVRGPARIGHPPRLERVVPERVRFAGRPAIRRHAAGVALQTRHLRQERRLEAERAGVRPAPVSAAPREPRTVVAPPPPAARPEAPVEVQRGAGVEQERPPFAGPRWRPGQRRWQQLNNPDRQRRWQQMNNPDRPRRNWRQNRPFRPGPRGRRGMG